jgi:hypothetical protein
MMRMEETAPRKPLNYGVGALVVLLISAGVATIAYGLGFPFDWLNIPAWLLGPLGLYTFVYALASGKDSIYYFVWGAIIVAISVVLGFYNVVTPLIIIGILAIVIAVIGIVAYQRSKK